MFHLRQRTTPSAAGVQDAAGAWQFMAMRLPDLVDDGRRVRYIGREEAASPATGSYKEHAREQAGVLDLALKPS